MTISRLENSKQDMTVRWMQRLARIFEGAPADLLDAAALGQIENDVEPVTAEGSLNQVASAIAERGLHLYRVRGPSASGAGVKPGDTITVDQSTDAIANVRSGVVVLVRIKWPQEVLVLRQFISPNVLLTNRPGPKTAIDLDDSTVKPTILGVVPQKTPGV
jgi:hypothetical protein